MGKAWWTRQNDSCLHGAYILLGIKIYNKQEEQIRWRRYATNKAGNSLGGMGRKVLPVCGIKQASLRREKVTLKLKPQIKTSWKPPRKGHPRHRAANIRLRAGMSLERTRKQESRVASTQKYITHFLEERGRYGKGQENMLRWSSEFTPMSRYLWGGEFFENWWKTMDPRKMPTYWFLLIILEYTWTLWSPPRNDLIAAFKLKPHYSQLVRVWGLAFFTWMQAILRLLVFPTTTTNAIPSRKVSYPSSCVSAYFHAGQTYIAVWRLPA